jgi:hypothetical protein
LEQRLRRSGAIVELVVIPKKLTLTSINPDAPVTGTVIRQDAVTGQKHSQVVRSQSSTWDGNAYFPFWGGELAISLTADGARPDVQQLVALKTLLDHTATIRSLVEQSVYNYYCEKIQPHGPRKEDGTPLPAISSPEEIAEIVFLPPTVCLDVVRDQRLRFSLRFGAKWNYYAVEVDLENWEIVSVG